MHNPAGAWEKIEERLKKAFKVTVSFPAGTVWLPDARLTLDDWLNSIANTDEEFRELNIPKIRFLQNRWPLEKLLELEWDGEFANTRAIWAMYVGRRAYILFSGGIDYQVIAAIEPRKNPALYHAVISKILKNPNFVPTPPTNIKNRHPDLIPEIFDNSFQQSGENILRDDRNGQAGSTPEKERPKHRYLSELLVGWIGSWIDLPVLGYWHEDVPDSIRSSKKGEFVMKYKPATRDKQGKNQDRQLPVQPDGKPAAASSKKK